MAKTATAVRNKNEEAIHLRSQVQTLTGEVQQLTKQLAEKSGVAAQLEEKKRVLVEAAANEKSKPGAIASAHAEVIEAQAPVELLQKRLTEKQGELDAAKSALESLNREIVVEAQQAARQARFTELKTELIAAGAVIGETLRRFIQDDLPRFDAARDALTREIVGGHFAQQTTAEGREARELIHRVMQEWTAGDASTPAITRKLLRSDPAWTTRGDIRLGIENLTPPKR